MLFLNENSYKKLLVLDKKKKTTKVEEKEVTHSLHSMEAEFLQQLNASAEKHIIISFSIFF